MLAGCPSDCYPIPSDTIRNRRHLTKAHGNNLGCLVRLTQDWSLLGQKLLGGRVEVIGMQVRDECEINIGDDLLRQTRKID
jgi:hypothetical protein